MVQPRTDRAHSGSGDARGKAECFWLAAHGNFATQTEVETEPRLSDIQTKHM
jgi:hypothetical protein